MTTTQGSLNPAQKTGFSNPLTAWLTPRAAEREIAFRERTIRGMILLEALLLLTAITLVFALPELPKADAVIWGVLLLNPLAAAIAVSRQRVTLAGIILLGMFFIAIGVVVSRNGFWGQTALFVMMLAFPLAAVILPRRTALGATILLGLEFIGLVIWQVTSGITPETLTRNVVANPVANIFLNSMGFLFLIAIGVYLLNEFDSRLRDLQALISTLEKRVAERTAELEIAKNEAEEARAVAEQANEIKSRFLANMSHELRTPLNAILNFTAFVADGVMGPVNTDQVDALNQAINSGKHLLSLINDVLDITKIEAGMMDLFVEDVDMNATLAAAVSVGKGLVKDKSLTLMTDIADDLPVTYGDRRRMRQVFLNLLSNAIKFTHKGHVAFRAHRKDAGIEIVVEDTGIGIAPEDQHLVFESFRQVNKHNIDAVGTGLGLPISKHFVELHGGKMWFTSEPGVGTTFYVYLPTLTEAEAEAIAHSLEAA